MHCGGCLHRKYCNLRTPLVACSVSFGGAIRSHSSWTRTLLGGLWNDDNFCATRTASLKLAQNFCITSVTCIPFLKLYPYKYIYVCVRVFIYLLIYLSIYLSTYSMIRMCEYIYIHVKTCVCEHMKIYLCKCVRVRVFISVCIYVCTYVHICIRIYVEMR